MSWFQRMMAIFMPALQRSGDGSETVRILQLGRTAAGVPIDADTALKNAVVWACVTYLSRTVAQLPWRVLRETSKGAARAPMHPVEYLIHTRPNPEMSSFAFRETMVGWAARYGNAVAEIQWDRRGIPAALWPLHPSRVTFERDNATGELLFGFTGSDGAKRFLRGEDVFHVRGFGEGAVGLDVIAYASETIGWAQATETFGATFFGNGASLSGFVTMPGTLSPDGKTAVERRFSEKHAGTGKHHKVMVLDANMKFEKSSVAPDEAQFTETMQHQVDSICRWFGVPPHKVMHLLRSTFSNIEHQSIEVVQDSITPWCLRFEQEANHKLFGQNRLAHFTKMDLKGLLRGDFKSRQEGLQIMRRNGIVNGNEWRALEDMDDIGPDGDKYICEVNMTTLEAIGQTPQVVTAAQVVAPESAAADDESAVDRARKQAARAMLH